jgi:hypothetical protein
MNREYQLCIGVRLEGVSPWRTIGELLSGTREP